MTYTITGATGHLGTLVMANMLKLVVPNELRAAVHTPSKAQSLVDKGVDVVAIDYLQPDKLAQALQGTDTLVYIPSKTYSVLDRVTELENILAAMKQAAVSHIIAVSFFADQEDNPFTMSAFYGYLPRRLASSGFKYAILKNSLYADPLIPYLPELIQRQNLIYPVGDQALSFISYADSAEAIAKLATQPTLNQDGQSYLLSQTQNYTMPTLGALMTEATGHKIGYAPVTNAEFAEIYATEGDGQELASMYRAGEMGLLAQTSTAFETITGHEPQDMAAFLKTNYHA